MTENFKNLTIGMNIKSEKGPIYLSDSSRKSSLLVIGAKNSGKSQFVVPVLVKQDLEQRDAGMTIIVSQKDAAYNIYAMAKKLKRKVILLKPEVNFEIINDFLWKEDWDYNYINDNIINYKKAIREKTIVIIDMEYSRYRINATRATSMLLLQLQADMSEVSTTLTRRHFVYIDDAYRYLPFIEQLLYEGDTYNMSTTLFIQGRNQLTTYDKDYSAIVDNNVRNTILMPGLNYEDTRYYSERLCPPNKRVKEYTHEMMMRKYGEFVYELVGSDYEKYIGNGYLLGIEEDEREQIQRSGKKARKKLRVEFKNEVIARRLQLQEEIISAEKLPKITGDTLTEEQPSLLEEVLIPETEEKEEDIVEQKDVKKKKPPVNKEEVELTANEQESEPEDALMSLLGDDKVDVSDIEAFDDFPDDDMSDYDFSLEEKKEGGKIEETEKELEELTEDDTSEEDMDDNEDEEDEDEDDIEEENDTNSDNEDDIDIYEDFDIVLSDLPEIPKEKISFRPIRLNNQLHIQSAQEQFNKELRDKFEQ